MSTFTDAAPNLSKLVNEADFRTDFPAPPPAPAPVDDTPSGGVKAALYAYVRDALAQGPELGYRDAAAATGAPVRWVKILHREVLAARAALYTVEPG